MPARYREPHWAAFAATEHANAGPIGFIPADWVKKNGLDDIPASDALPRELLDRHEVRAVCQDRNKDVLFGFVCAMAWGSLGARGGSRRVAGIWAQRVQLADRLARLREGNLTRVEAYNLFLGEGDIHQLGPSYFTKLLFFFSPTPDFYIMDQWTGKSINLLTGIPVVRMTRRNDATPLPSNKAGNYQAYCEEVDIIAKRLGVKGEQAEEMLMSKGRPDPWPWRLHVRQYWESDAPMVRYRATELHERYPHIPVEDF